MKSSDPLRAHPGEMVVSKFPGKIYAGNEGFFLISGNCSYVLCCSYA